MVTKSTVSAYSLSRLPASVLATMQTDAQNAITGILTTAQSYTIGGRTFNKANLDDVILFLAAIAEAQAIQQGLRIKTTYADFR